MIRKLAPYMMAGIGPVGTAGSQFILSLVLLRLLPPSDFGSFAFLLVASQLSWGLWSALFCAPLPVILHQYPPAERPFQEQCLLSSSMFGASLAIFVFGGIALALKVQLLGAILFGLYGAISLLRWYARAYAYSKGMPRTVMWSDLLYGGALLFGIAALALAHDNALIHAYAALFIASVCGLLAFGKAYLIAQFVGFRLSAVAAYPNIWCKHSGWSLLGVLTTEATANSHAYIITAFFGPKAFAPIAASAILIRPIGVAMNALTDFERARMAARIGVHDSAGAASTLPVFRGSLIAIWAVTAFAAIGLFLYNPRIIFPAHYDLIFLMMAATLWMMVSAIRLLRTPESALLQAAGAFRPLAFASIWSSAVSVAAVFILLWVGGIVWSIGGVLLGETVYALWIWRKAREWKLAGTTKP